MKYQQLKQAQPLVVRLLEQNILRGRLANMYLFHGDKGSLMTDAAIYAAGLILGKPIGTLDMDIVASSQVQWVEAEKETIKKEQIQSLIHNFSLTSEGKRVFIINHVDQASAASGNSLLKFLEESNENVYGILITESINLVLPTIQSRCQIVRFGPVNYDLIAKELTEAGYEVELALATTYLTSNLDEAKECLKDKIYLQIFDLAKNMAVNFEEETLDGINLISEQGRFLMKEGSKTYHHYFVDLLAIIQSEKIKYLQGIKEHLIFSSLLEQMTLNLDVDQQIKILEIVMELKSKIKYNINMELAYLEMLIRIKRC